MGYEINEGQERGNGENAPESLLEYIERIEREYFERTGEKMPMVECGWHWVEYDVS